MRPINSFALHATLAVALAALAATSAAAADAYLKLGDPKGEVSGGGQIEIQSFHWGPRQSTSADGSYAHGKLQPGGGGAGAAQKDVAMKGSAIDENAPPATPAAVTEKRQHGWVTVSKPVESGSMRLVGRLPGCAVGAAYPHAVLQTAGARYELKDVVISGCSADGATLDYAKVKVRGWDPEKKEE